MVDKNKGEFPVKITVALFAYAVTIALFTNTSGLFFVSVSEHLGIGRGEFSLYYSLQCIATMITLIFSGKIIQKHHKKIKIVLLFAISLQFLGYIIFSQGTALWHWFLGGIFVGIGNAFDAHLLIGILANNWFKKRTGTIIGLVFAWVSLVAAIISPIISSTIANYSFRAGYFGIGLLAFIVIVPTIIFLVSYQPSDIGKKAYGEEENVTQKQMVDKTKSVKFSVAVKSSAFWFILLFSFFVSCWSAFIAAMPGFAESVGFSPVMVGTVISTVLIGGIIGKLILGYLNDKIGTKNATLVSVILGVIGMVLLINNNSETATTFFVGAFLYGFAFAITGVIPPIVTMTCFGPEDYSPIYSNIQISLWVSVATATPIFNFVYDKTGSYVNGMLLIIGFLIAGYICMIGALAISQKLPKEISVSKTV